MNFKKIYLLSCFLCLFFINNTFANQTLLSWDTNDESWKPLTRNWFDVSHLQQKFLENWAEYFIDNEWKLYMYHYELFPKAKRTDELHYNSAMKIWELKWKINDFVWMFSENENDEINKYLHKFEKKFWKNILIITLYKKEWNTFDQLFKAINVENNFDWILFLIKENDDLYFVWNDNINSELFKEYIYWENWFKQQYLSNQKFSWIQIFLNNIDERLTKEWLSKNNEIIIVPEIHQNTDEKTEINNQNFQIIDENNIKTSKIENNDKNEIKNQNFENSNNHDTTKINKLWLFLILFISFSFSFMLIWFLNNLYKKYKKVK